MKKAITRDDIARAVCQYFIERKNIARTHLGEEMHIDKRQIKDWMEDKAKVREGSYHKILAYTDQKIRNTTLHPDSISSFCDYLINYFDTKGYNAASIGKILDEHFGNKLSERLEFLVSEYDPNEFTTIFHEINPQAIISRLSEKMSTPAMEYYYQIPDQKIFIPPNTKEFSQYLHWENDPHDPSVLIERNYLILSFPDDYRVLLIVAPEVENTVVKEHSFFEAVKSFKEENNIKLVIFFTDQDMHNIPYSTQHDLLKNCNVLFEYISDKDIQSASLPNLTLHQLKMNEALVNVWLYAEVVMERMGTYYSIIRNEVIFSHNFPISENKPDNYDSFVSYLNIRYLKNTFHYAYMARHSIYFERTLAATEAKKIIAKRVSEFQKKHPNQDTPDSIKELDLVVELCAPNAFVSASIAEYSKKLMLFTGSKNAYDKMSKDFKDAKEAFERNNRENQKDPFPDNIELHLNHPNPEIITNSHSEELQHKADMVILGFGMGSNLADLKEYLRWINLWLKDDGVVFISFVNSNSVLLKKESVRMHSLERKPLIDSHYWHYETTQGLRFLIRTKCYNAAQVKAEFITFVENRICYSYPYLLALTDHIRNPDIRKTLREQDKHYALKLGVKEGIYEGHYLHAIGTKNSNPDSKSIRQKRHGDIMDQLVSSNLHFEPIEHADTVDTANLYRILLEKSGLPSSDFHLLKLVILMSRSKTGFTDKGELIYCILPREKEVRYNKYYFVPFNEKAVIKVLGHGTITPFIAIPEIAKGINESPSSAELDFSNWKGKVCIFDSEQLTKDYVIVASGISTMSLKIKRTDFLEFFQKLNNREKKAIKMVGSDILL